MRKICLLLLVLFSVQMLRAQNIVTDRPDQTEAASTIPKGSFQIETGILIMDEDREIVDQELILPTTLFRYGLTDIFELRVVHEYSIRKWDPIRFTDGTYTGFNDLQFGFKLFIFEGGITQISLLSHAVAPTGTSSFGGGDWGTINKLSIAHDISDNFSVGYNVGYDYLGDDFITYSLALGFSLTDKLGAYLEPFGAFNDGDHSSNYDMGVTYLLKPNVQLDFSFGFGLNNSMNYSSFGISWNIPSKSGKK